MKKTRPASLFALVAVAALAAGGPTAASGERAASLASSVRAFASRLVHTRAAGAAGATARVRGTGVRVEARAAGLQTPRVALGAEGAAVPTEYVGGPGVALLAGGTRAHALASADFDEDGTPDLVVGFEAASGGVVTLQRGNADAVYPESAGARERRARGLFVDAPFREASGAFGVPEAAHFVGAGDFDADGHSDVVALRRGGNALYLLRGDGRGNLAAPERVELPGAATAFVTGEVNRRDGLTDVVVAVGGVEGAAALVFESPAGALRGRPEAIALPSAASGLALGALDGDASGDLAVAAGRELVVVHGRDRRLSSDEELRAAVPGALLSRDVFEFALAGVAVGDFAGDGRADVAVLSDDGAVQVLTRAGGGDGAALAVEWRRSEWASVRDADGATSASSATLAAAASEATEAPGASSHLLTAKVSALSKDDLLVTGGGRVYVITNDAAKVKTAGKVRRRESATSATAATAARPATAADLRVSASVGAEGGLAAALPMRLNASALSSLVVFGAGGKAPTVLSAAAAVTFTVNSAGDGGDVNPGNGECKDAGGNCTLRAAASEIQSSANLGPYTVNFNIPGAGVPTISTPGHSGFGYFDKPVVIDGTTQPAGRVEIIDTTGHYGLLRVAGGNSTVRGLVVGGSAEALHLTGNNNVVEGNYFGTNADGTAAAARRNQTGIVVASSNNLIGGTGAGARNVISGAVHFGIYVGAGTGNRIQGNYIGTNAAGTAAVGNRGGILTFAPDLAVGGTAPGAGNLISGNGGGAEYALRVSANSGVSSVNVQGNLFGTNASGDAQIGNTNDALHVVSYNAGTTIGGTSPAARNVISGSTGRGIYLTSFGSNNPNPASYVQGNYVGTSADGTLALPNLGHGVDLDRANITLGGTAPGAGNVIAHNAESGVASDRSWVMGAVLSNSIHSNEALGVDADDDGVSPVSNESDANRPEMLSAVNGAAGTTVKGRIYNYGAVEPFTIQFFSDTACDPSGYGEGRTLVAQASVPAPNRYTYVDFDATISPALPAGTVITALNVRAANPSLPAAVLYTSEFSNCVRTAAPTPTPTPTPDPNATPTPTPAPTPAPTPSPTPAPAPLGLFVIAPARGGDAAAVTRQLTGQGFQEGATAKLTRAGQPDIVGAAAAVTNGGTTLSATFDLAGRERGAWSVVVTNPGGETATLPDAFTIGEARDANVWADIVGRFKMRLGRSQQFYVAYGNTGDVDAPAALVQVFVPSDVAVEQLPESSEGRGVSVVKGAGDSIIQFYVSRLPADSSFFIPLRLRVPVELAHQTLELRATVLSAESLREEFNPPPSDPTITVAPTEMVNEPGRVRFAARVSNGAGASEDYEFDHTYTATSTPEELRLSEVEAGDRVEYTLTVTVPRAGAAAGAALKPSTAVRGGMTAQDEETPDLMKHRVRILTLKEAEDILLRHPELQPARKRDSLEQRILRCLAERGILEEGDVTYYKKMEDADRLASRLKLLAGITQAMTKDPKGYDPYMKEVERLSERLDGDWYDETTSRVRQDILFGRESYKRYSVSLVELVKQSEREKTPGRNSRAELLAERMLFLDILYKCKCDVFKGLPPGFTDRASAAKGAAAAEAGAGKAGRLRDDPGCGCLVCLVDERDRDLDVVFAHDPNDKVGPRGDAEQHYVTGAAPMPYVIFFENKPDATAPAQDVIITDQLDVSKFDLSTFQLGPVAFGRGRVATPPPGLTRWTTDVDLRPGDDLVVRVDAGLDPRTGVVRWAFTSLDPSTGLPTEDPEAGFLPPNKTAPEGEGSVLFNVSPRPGLATGSEVRNGARIVFDVNAPLDTPVWVNTVDGSPPTSRVAPLAAAQPHIVFYVNWEGEDAGSGVRDYTVYFSEDGGPHNVWLAGTAETSAIFVGRPGRAYSFHALARDRAGNVEAAKTSPEATTATPNVVSNPVDDARFFVLQHYRDFLGRDPDPQGFDFWTDQIAACGADAGCVDNMRANVSRAFFLSIEFQQTGYFVQRLYRATFGEGPRRPRALPRMDELLADARAVGAGVVVGAAGWEQRLKQNRQAFARGWVVRAEVLAELPDDMTAGRFVDKLFATSGAAPTREERDAALAAFGAGGVEGRAAALRSVAESGSVYNEQYNAAFVLMQYVGYLRRNPDDAPDRNHSGYDFWLAKMDQFSSPGEDVRDAAAAQRRVQRAEMVRAFLVSDEFRGRFVPR